MKKKGKAHALVKMSQRLSRRICVSPARADLPALPLLLPVLVSVLPIFPASARTCAAFIVRAKALRSSSVERASPGGCEGVAPGEGKRRYRVK
jgi:hypothetical protein